jgi:hypothetical protein
LPPCGPGRRAPGTPLPGSDAAASEPERGPVRSTAHLEPPVCLDQPAAMCDLHPAPVVLSLAQVRRLLKRPRKEIDTPTAKACGILASTGTAGLCRSYVPSTSV